ncbi:hypothetical protein ACIO02_34105 [Streptomyces sp. NPDC087568]|uniref:hypothetical protein n=1 Tax=Streptomyces sp. NPDC087568 TaxID=3365799 RepID=UPI00381F261B
MTSADELHTAAATMRALPGPAAEPIARLLDALASSAHDEGAPFADAALAAARAINGTQLAAATASRRAPLPHAERLDRFAQVIYEHWNPDRQWKDAHPDDQVAYRADAVVAMNAADAVAGVPYALPLRTDVYREVADRLSLFTELERAQAAGVAGIPSTVREWAERIDAETATAVQPPVDRAALRESIAQALHQDQTPPPVVPWKDELPLDREYFLRRADVVLAVLPEPADRAAALERVRKYLEARLDQVAVDPAEVFNVLTGAAEPPLSPYYSHEACGFHWHGRDGMDIPMQDGQPVCPRCELRRLADETQPAPELAAAQQTTVVTHVYPAPGGVASALRDTARFKLGRRV